MESDGECFTSIRVSTLKNLTGLKIKLSNPDFFGMKPSGSSKNETNKVL